AGEHRRATDADDAIAKQGEPAPGLDCLRYRLFSRWAFQAVHRKLSEIDAGFYRVDNGFRLAAGAVLRRAYARIVARGGDVACPVAAAYRACGRHATRQYSRDVARQGCSARIPGPRTQALRFGRVSA